MVKTDVKPRSKSDLWNKVFAAKDAVNLAPPEAVVRTVSYHLRSHYKPREYGKLHFLDVGCGGGAMLIWLAQKGVKVSGLDISSRALKQAHSNILRRTSMLKYFDRMDILHEGDITTKVPWPDNTFDGITTSNVLQHLDKEGRTKAFAEIRRLLKPGGCLVSYEMSTVHDARRSTRTPALAADPWTFIFGKDSPFGNVGLTHFFTYQEWDQYLGDFAHVDPCQVIYEIPQAEAERRNCGRRWAFFCVYAVK